MQVGINNCFANNCWSSIADHLPPWTSLVLLLPFFHFLSPNGFKYFTSRTFFHVVFLLRLSQPWCFLLNPFCFSTLIISISLPLPPFHCLANSYAHSTSLNIDSTVFSLLLALDVIKVLLHSRSVTDIHTPICEIVLHDSSITLMRIKARGGNIANVVNVIADACCSTPVT